MMKNYYSAIIRMTLFILPGFVLLGCMQTPSPEKMAKKSQGAATLVELKRDGEYFIVTGSDVHNLCGDLLGKKIRFRGKVDKTQGQMWGLAKPLMRILADDGEFYVWVSEGATVPEDFKTAVKKGGLQVSESVELWCTLDELPSESVSSAYSELRKRSGITQSIDKWGR